MKTTTFALAALAGSAAAQGVTDKITPPGSAPAGCSASFGDKFEVSVLDVTVAKRDIVKRGSTCQQAGILVASLNGGVMKDALDRTGYIASNFQFQFDGPPQAGALYTAGWTVCGNNSLALGPSTTFYKCQSGDFYNLYDRHWAAQCSPVQIAILPCGAADPPEDAAQRGDGQVIGTTVRATTIVVPLSDGQPQVITTQVPVPVCQVSQIQDGQIQWHTTPCASITAAPRPSTTAVPVSQFTDGQIQVTPGPGAPGAGPRPTGAAPSGGAGGSASAPAPTGGATARPSSTLVSSPSGTASRPAASSTTAAASNAAAGVSSPLAALAIGILGAVLVL